MLVEKGCPTARESGPGLFDGRDASLEAGCDVGCVWWYFGKVLHFPMAVMESGHPVLEYGGCP